MNKLIGILLVILGPALLLLSLAAFVATFRAFTVQSTLAAVESIFGTLVVAIAMLVLARLSFRAGIRRLNERK